MNIILINLFYNESDVFRISNVPYIFPPNNDVFPNAVFNDVLSGGVTLSASIGSNKSIGEIEFYFLDIDIYNINFTRYEIYILNGNNISLFSKGNIISTNIINKGIARVSIQDDLSNIDVDALTDVSINGDLTPILIGKCNNVTPKMILEDVDYKIYAVSSISCDIEQVRHNGDVVTVENNNDGTFKMLTPRPYTFGAVTCDVSNNYNTIIKSINYLLSKVGLEVSDIINIDQNVLDSEVGFYSYSQRSILSIINDICDSVGIFIRVNEFGDIQLVGSNILNETDNYITDDSILSGEAHQVAIFDKKNVIIGYGKNYTVQEYDAYNYDYKYVRSGDNYNDMIINTLLVNFIDAERERNRLSDIMTRNRESWSISIIYDNRFSYNIGDIVHINSVFMRVGYYSIVGFVKNMVDSVIRLRVITR